MRNDVKLGLAIGGVLLAVLIVYVLVVPGPEQPGTELATAESGATTSVEGANTGATTGAQSDTTSALADAGKTSDDVQREATGSTGGASAQSGATADASKTTPAGGFDWDKLLNGEAAAQVPSLSSGTDIQTSPTQVAGTNAPTVPADQQASGTTAAPIVPDPAVTQDQSIAQQPTATPPAQTGDQAVATPAAPARTHIVQPNETFSSIAAAAYGSPNFYPHIQRANPGIDPGKLKPGTKINLPDISAVKPNGTASAAGKNEPAIDPNSQYRVEPNDSLHRISIKLYGKSDRADKIYQLNKETIGEDPARVKPGMVLKLPESPTVTASSR